MALLKVHQSEDSRYDINWVVANNKTAMVNRNYVERHEPVYCGVSIIVPAPEEAGNFFMEYGHNEDGFMSTSEYTSSNRNAEYEVLPINQAIAALTANTRHVLRMTELHNLLDND